MKTPDINIRSLTPCFAPSSSPSFQPDTDDKGNECSTSMPVGAWLCLTGSMKARLKLFIGGFLFGELVAFGLMQSASFHSDSGFLLFFLGMGVIFGGISAVIGPERMNRVVDFISHVI